MECTSIVVFELILRKGGRATLPREAKDDFRFPDDTAALIGPSCATEPTLRLPDGGADSWDPERFLEGGVDSRSHRRHSGLWLRRVSAPSWAIPCTRSRLLVTCRRRGVLGPSWAIPPMWSKLADTGGVANSYGLSGRSLGGDPDLQLLDRRQLLRPSRAIP